MVKKCQAITIQFKNGWVSKKRDVLRKYQDRYVQEQEEKVKNLRKEIAEHSTRLKQEELIEKEKLLEQAERLRREEHSELKAEREARAAINEEVSELTGAASSGGDVSDSDDDEEENLDDEKFDLDALVDQQKEIKEVIAHIGKKKALVQLAATRWMTYVAVVERTLMWRTALKQALDEISTDPSFKKKKNPEVDLTSLRISEEEADVLEQFRGIGASCRKTLQTLEADDFPTIGSLVYHHSKLLKYLNNAAKGVNVDTRIRKFCELAAANCAVKIHCSGRPSRPNCHRVGSPVSYGQFSLRCRRW